MKKLLAVILVALMVIPFGVMMSVGADVASDVIYVKEGATGDGSSADNALGSLHAANQAAAAVANGNVTIKIVGTVTLDYTDANAGIFDGNYYYVPTHAANVTLTGADATAKLVFKTGTTARYYMMGGDLCIKDLAIETDGSKVLCLVTRLNDLTVDTGVTTVNTKVSVLT